MDVMFSFVGSERISGPNVIFCLPVAHVERLDSIIGLRRVMFKKRAYHSDATPAKHLNSMRIFLQTSSFGLMVKETTSF